jgi:hypothetical protein
MGNKIGKMLAGLVTLFLAVARADAQSVFLKLPDVSQHASVSQRIGLSDITVDYHRPQVAGRKIFGGLQAYGEVWRAGANVNTTIAVSDSVKIDGHPLAPGTYGLHMIPGDTSWIIIFSKNSSSWGSFTYDSTEDALRVRIKPRTIPLQEVLTYDFHDPRPTSVALWMQWERVAVPLRIDVDTPHLVAGSLRKQLRGRVQTEWQAWEEAANYLLENSLYPEEALRYAERSVQIEDRFENEVTKARALAASGRTDSARAVQEKALGMGSQVQVYNFARTLQRLGQQDAAIEIFRNDMRRNPDSAYGHLEAARVAVAGHNFDLAIKEANAAIAAAPSSFKPAIQGLLEELKQGVDVNR